MNALEGLDESKPLAERVADAEEYVRQLSLDVWAESEEQKLLEKKIEDAQKEIVDLETQLGFDEHGNCHFFGKELEAAKIRGSHKRLEVAFVEMLAALQKHNSVLNDAKRNAALDKSIMEAYTTLDKKYKLNRHGEPIADPQGHIASLKAHVERAMKDRRLEAPPLPVEQPGPTRPEEQRKTEGSGAKAGQTAKLKQHQVHSKPTPAPRTPASAAHKPKPHPSGLLPDVKKRNVVSDSNNRWVPPLVSPFGPGPKPRGKPRDAEEESLGARRRNQDSDE